MAEGVDERSVRKDIGNREIQDLHNEIGRIETEWGKFVNKISDKQVKDALKKFIKDLVGSEGLLFLMIEQLSTRIENIKKEVEALEKIK